jgi:hypothetical protein
MQRGLLLLLFGQQPKQGAAHGTDQKAPVLLCLLLLCAATGLAVMMMAGTASAIGAEAGAEVSPGEQLLRVMYAAISLL